MANYWDIASGGAQEFLASTELYISTTAASNLRKPMAPRKKSDKRDSLKPLGQGDDGSSKVKEKSSWLSLGRVSTGTGHWRSATCKLSEEGDRCSLNVYVDETILYQTLYIHLLNQTDIRQADSSLFNLRDCIVIYCATGQRWTSISTGSEPVYLHFSSTEMCNTWLALLWSYAIPEIYGRWVMPQEGGSYRMWRQVELTIVQGRNLGTTKLPDTVLNYNAHGEQPETDGLDLDLTCDILLNDNLCGKTSTKRGIGSPDWHEKFTFSDLPPFDTLDIVVCREKKHVRHSILGTVQITLANFRRGEAVEGWFPAMHHGPIASDLQVGDLRLKIRIDEEIILPYAAYSSLLKIFNSRNFLNWMSDFENKLKLKTIATQLMSIAIARNVVIDHIQELAIQEVEGASTTQSTLFRGNTTLTKVVELCMTWYGKAFLEASIGDVLRKLCVEKVSIEVDPIRNTKGAKDVEKSVDILLHWVREFWSQINAAKTQCPQELRRLFETIRKSVEGRFGKHSESGQAYNRDLPQQGVSAFCFLRLIVPAILHPHLFGLCSGLPPAPVQRSLTLIAKVIQSLANLNVNVQKEGFMRGIKEFLVEKRHEMTTYIQVVSTPLSERGYTHKYEDPAEYHDRLNILHFLRQKAATMAVLDREAIPILPHLLDVPRHLAIITSAVIRHSRDFCTQSRNSADTSEQTLINFCSRCFEVEEHALQRVSDLATQISSGRRKTSLQSWSQTTTTSIVASPAMAPLRQRTAFVSSPNSNKKKKTGRPSTAPSPFDNGATRQGAFVNDGNTSLDFFMDRAGGALHDDKRARPPQLKSPSTDSVPLKISPSSDTRAPDTTNDVSDDGGKRKLGLLRGILRR